MLLKKNADTLNKSTRSHSRKQAHNERLREYAGTPTALSNITLVGPCPQSRNHHNHNFDTTWAKALQDEFHKRDGPLRRNNLNTNIQQVAPHNQRKTLGHRRGNLAGENDVLCTVSPKLFGNLVMPREAVPSGCERASNVCNDLNHSAPLIWVCDASREEADTSKPKEKTSADLATSLPAARIEFLSLCL